MDDHHNQEPFIELIPDLPEELALECLTRSHYSTHRVSSQVCRRWHHLILSKGFYYQRKITGFTHKTACLVQAIPVQSGSKPDQKPKCGISLFDPVTFSWIRFDPVPKYPDGLPMFCQVVGTEGKLVVMGGWDPSSWEPVRDVFLFDFTTQRWTQFADMPSTRSFFAVGALGGKVFVAGGHDEGKNALSSAWVFDIKKNEWTELTRMSEERDECEGVVIGSEFWVVSGYGTESQGVFASSADVYDVGSGEWRRVEDTWGVSRCPRSCVGVLSGKDESRNSLICWGELDSAVQVGACGVDLGKWILVTGSPYQGAPHGFFLVDKSQGQKGKLIKIDDVPEEFAGFVQSGCCVEI